MQPPYPDYDAENGPAPKWDDMAWEWIEEPPEPAFPFFSYVALFCSIVVAIVVLLVRM